MGHGNKVEKAFVFQRPVKLRQGANHIAILGMIVGLPVCYFNTNYKNIDKLLIIYLMNSCSFE